MTGRECTRLLRTPLDFIWKNSVTLKRQLNERETEGNVSMRMTYDEIFGLEAQCLSDGFDSLSN